MIKLLVRILIAIGIAVVLSTIGIVGNTAVLQTLFTVLGIVFSISMSLLVSFSLSKIRNKKIRSSLRESISRTRNMLLQDFAASTAVLIISLIWNTNYMHYSFKSWTLDILLTGNIIIGMSLVYEIYNFRRIHSLNMDVEDAIIDEESNKQED